MKARRLLFVRDHINAAIAPNFDDGDGLGCRVWSRQDVPS